MTHHTTTHHHTTTTTIDIQQNRKNLNAKIPQLKNTFGQNNITSALSPIPGCTQLIITIPTPTPPKFADLRDNANLVIQHCQSLNIEIYGLSASRSPTTDAT